MLLSCSCLMVSLLWQSVVLICCSLVDSVAFAVVVVVLAVVVCSADYWHSLLRRAIPVWIISILLVIPLTCSILCLLLWCFRHVVDCCPAVFCHMSRLTTNVTTWHWILSFSFVLSFVLSFSFVSFGLLYWLPLLFAISFSFVVRSVAFVSVASYVHWCCSATKVTADSWWLLMQSCECHCSSVVLHDCCSYCCVCWCCACIEM